MTWSEVEVSGLLEADFFEFNLKLLGQNGSTSSTEITPEVYYEQLYVEPIKIDKYRNLLNKVKNSHRSNLFFIEGFAGCGKSTLVNRLFYDITKKENRRYDYTDFNYKLGNSRYDYNDGANTCPESSDEVNSLIREKLAVRIAPYFEGDTEVYKCFEYLAGGNNIFIIDKGRAIYRKLVKADVVKESRDNLYESDREGNIRTITELFREQLGSFKTSLLLATDFLLRLAQYIVFNERSYLYVAYDNLDAIDYPDVLEKFDDELVAFIDNLNTYIDIIYPIIMNKYGSCERKPAFAVFATYRKITASRVNLQRHEVKTENKDINSCIHRMDVSEYYNYCDIVNNKATFFLEEARKKHIKFPAANNLKMVVELNNAKIIRERYKAFWNHNFRGCANIMQKIVTNRKSCVPKGLELIKRNCDEEKHMEDLNVWLFTGASSIFLRIICDLFRDGDIFGSSCLNLITLNQSEEYGYTTLSRLILNFYNTQGKAQINKLFLALEGLYTPAEIVEVLAALLDKNDIWRRPLYYTAYALPNEGLKDELKNQAQYYENHDASFNRYTELQLCPCGELYINLVVTSFEFFACRCLKDSKSFYCEEDMEKNENVLNKVLEAVERCCINLSAMRMKIEQVRDISDEEFLKLPFHSITKSKKVQLHEERIIFSHISYLELFRRFKIGSITDEKKKDINKLMVDTIIGYLSLYDQYVEPIDKQRAERAKILRAKAEIIINAGYEDYKTKIQC